MASMYRWGWNGNVPAPASAGAGAMPSQAPVLFGQGLRRIEPGGGAGRNQRAQQRREQRDADAERDVFGLEPEERGRLERKVRQAGAGEPVEKRGRDPRQEDSHDAAGEP